MSDDPGETPSDTPATDGAPRPEPSTSVDSQTAVAPGTPTVPVEPVDGETRHRGSMVTRDAVVPAKPHQSGRVHTASDIAPALDAARVPGAPALPVGTRVRHASAPSHDLASPQANPPAAATGGGLSAGGSSSSHVGTLGLMSALLLIFLVHWSTVLLVTERWRFTVCLAPRERPG